VRKADWKFIDLVDAGRQRHLPYGRNPPFGRRTGNGHRIVFGSDRAGGLIFCGRAHRGGRSRRWCSILSAQQKR
jgi:hypothetical protein